MRLAYAGRAEQDDILSALDEAERVQALDLFALHTRLETEVEVSEGFDRGQSCRAHRGLEAPRIAELDVRAEELINRLAAGELAGVAAPEDVIERFERAGHLEISELRAQALTE
jgi:hypothetical protein